LLAILAEYSSGAQQSPARFTVRGLAANATWYKGNTHTHTTNSDGDTPPAQVARWYKAHGYAFLVLSDHNVFTDPATLASLVDSSFLLLPGEEVTTSYQRAAVHVNALAVTRVIAPPRDSTLLGTVQKTIDAIRAENAIPHINHPNFLWSIDTATLFRVRNHKLFEIHNGHPTVHNAGGGDWPGMEEAWDALLTRGRRLYGIAVDDAHHFQGEFAADRANPGRGWVVVRSPSLETRAIVNALEAGEFYASTGVTLDSVSATSTTIAIRIQQQGDFKYVTTFIGANGKVLATDRTLSPSYRLRGSESYVRAKVVNSGGAAAWTQPVFTSRYRDAAP
ncbi:MAG: CehA/McbA family metallohydrolase, partial [Gemmatimonas sp.]